jgi:hypothetical protein
MKMLNSSNNLHLRKKGWALGRSERTNGDYNTYLPENSLT